MSKSKRYLVLVLAMIMAIGLAGCGDAGTSQVANTPATVATTPAASPVRIPDLDPSPSPSAAAKTLEELAEELESDITSAAIVDGVFTFYMWNDELPGIISQVILRDDLREVWLTSQRDSLLNTLDITVQYLADEGHPGVPCQAILCDGPEVNTIYLAASSGIITYDFLNDADATAAILAAAGVQTPVPEAGAQTPVPEAVPDARAAFDEAFLGDLDPTFYKNVRDDVTGNWRVYVCYTNSDILQYAAQYYDAYFESDSEIHFIVNLYLRTTTRLSVSGTWLFVSTYEYTDGEEHSAKQLPSGMLLAKHIVYMDTGEIEDVTNG